MARVDGKVAVITGATSGIGLRTAEVFVASLLAMTEDAVFEGEQQCS
jgi:NADP-dependent 3-hydroxy acid dehydrogenase YdfG